jgi:membrane protease YdiL (CAAX protease family)
MIMRKPIHPLWGILEITGFTVCFFSVLWILGPRIETVKFAYPAYWMLILAGLIYLLWISPFILHCDPHELRGWGACGNDGSCPGSFKNAWRVYAVFTAIAAVVLIAYAWWLDPARLAHMNWKAFGLRFAGYILWGFVQVVTFFGFILTRIRAMIPLPAGSHSVLRHRLLVALVTTTIFAFYHLPNKPLMVFALSAGFCWSWVYYRQPNILLLAMSQAILGTLLHRVVQLHMRIGPFYAHPELYFMRNVIPGLKQVIGNLF